MAHAIVYLYEQDLMEILLSLVLRRQAKLSSEKKTKGRADLLSFLSRIETMENAISEVRKKATQFQTRQQLIFQIKTKSRELAGRPSQTRPTQFGLEIKHISRHFKLA